MRIFNKQTGETIIEVMLSVVILGFTMTTIYVVARRSLNTGQAASERSQVLAIVETQIERLKAMSDYDSDRRSNAAENIFLSNAPFCVGDDLQIRRPPTIDCYTDTFPDNAGLAIEIVYNAEGPDATTVYDNDTFNIATSWERADSSGSTEVLDTAYRLHPSVPPALPQVSCGNNAALNITEALRMNNSNDTSFDANYRPPQYVNPAGGDFSLDIDSQEKPESDPDFVIPTSLGLYINTACQYRADYTMWCTAPDSSNSYGQRPDCGGSADQPNEVLRIRFWDSFSGSVSANNVSCNGTQLAFIDTRDRPFAPEDPFVPGWNGSGTVSSTNNNIFSSGLARCMDVIHICELPYAEFQALNGRYNCSDHFWRLSNGTIVQAARRPAGASFYQWAGSSVHLNDVSWSVL